jgi:ssDNA-binding Zn-finger/Zn-ribbon topoisomerase 1
MTKRQPKGTPVGGQFAQDRKPSGGDLMVATYEEPPFSLVPQANNLAGVSSVVDAIADGCYSSPEIGEAVGMSGRQGDYYPHAAHTLGLVERMHDMDRSGWGLSEVGALFVGLDVDGRVDYLCNAIDGLEWVNTYLNDGPDALRDEWASEQNLGDTTIDRRLATIGAWISFRTDSRENQIKAISESMTGTRERTPGIVARTQEAIRSRRKNDQRYDARKCPKCHIIVAPSVDECENCGSSLEPMG